MSLDLAYRIIREDRAEAELTEAIGEILSKADAVARESADGLGVAVDPAPALERVQAGITDDLAAMIRRDAAILRSIANDVILGIVEPEALASALETSVGRAQTAANTALAAVQRSLALDAAQIIGTRYAVYTGPLGADPKTRPYCAALADLAVDLDRLAATPNGTGLSPLLFLGGYNCRHTLIPIALEDAEAMGVSVASEADYIRAEEGGRR
jgi:hypothetical protein